MDFRAEGGGDTPEAVNKALSDAINTISWSSDQNAYRTVFLVGDAPPKEYQDEASYPQTGHRAVGFRVRQGHRRAGS
jgi:hypothetical protein